MHGTQPNSSSRCRFAQFVKAFPASPVTDERLRRRCDALLRLLPPELSDALRSYDTDHDVDDDDVGDAAETSAYSALERATAYRLFGFQSLSTRLSAAAQASSSLSSS